LNRNSPLGRLLLSGASFVSMVGAACAQEQTDEVVVTATGRASSPQEAPAEVTTISGIVVTATGRASSLQDTPVAVTAISGDVITNTGVSDLRDLGQLAPSLTINSGESGSAGTVASIRGVGTGSNNPSFEGSVGVFIDGVYRARVGQAISDLPEIARIEVLRGPQGTLFGRNTSAGAISVVTAGPYHEAGMWMDATFGFDDLGEAGASVGGNLPVVDGVLALRFDGSVRARDGYFHDIASGNDLHDRDRSSARLQALWDIAPRASLRVIIDRSDADEACCGATPVEYDAVAGVQAVIDSINLANSGQPQRAPIDPDRRQMSISPGRDYQDVTQESGVSAELSWDWGFADFSSITARREFEARRNQDIDFNYIDILYRDGQETRFENFTQEFRLHGQAGNLDWLLGVFYSEETITLTDRIRQGADFSAYLNTLTLARTGGLIGFFGPGMSGLSIADLIYGPGPDYAAPLSGQGQIADRWVQDSQGVSVFSHNEISLTDNTVLTVGLRYNDEQRDARANLAAFTNTCNSTLTRAAANFPATIAFFLNPANTQLVDLVGLSCIGAVNPLTNGDYAGSRREGEWSGTLSIRHHFSGDLMVYGGVSRGYKSGGFNLDRAGFAATPIGPAPGVASFSLSQLEFNQEFTDNYEVGLRSTILNGTTFINVTGFHQQLSDYQQNSFNGINFDVANVPEVVSQGVEFEISSRPIDNLDLRFGVTYLDAYYDTTVNFSAPTPDPSGANTVVAGQALQLQPPWRVSAGVSYEHVIADNLRALFYLDARWDSEVASQTPGRPASGSTDMAAITILNGRIAVGAPSGGWQFEFWGRNLADESSFAGFSAPLQPGTYLANVTEPRTFGVTLRVRH